MRLYVGFITYGESTAKYLPYFLPSLKNQIFKDFKILAVDNSQTQENKNSSYIKNNYPEIDLKWAGENLGFAKAFNLMIRQAVANGVEYFLALNPDMILEADVINGLMTVAQSEARIAAVQPKILKWNFENNTKTSQVDSYGVICDRKFRFRDRGQGQQDKISGGGSEEIFGFTGAAVLLNLRALLDVVFDNEKNFEYFDELMFMYKEDCDLSLRLRLAGWKIMLAREAVVYHDRTASRVGDSIWQIIKNRRGKRRQIKEWSFWGQWVIVLKFSKINFSLRTIFLIFWYQVEILIFSLLFEQYLLKKLINIWQARSEIKKRREQLKVKININEVERLII